MSDPIQHELERIYKFFKEEYPDYGYNQLEARLHAYLSSQMSKFRHRVNNPEQYTGIKYDPTESKCILEEFDDVEDVIFLSSKTTNC
jgi:hypothetical protein